MKDDKAQMMVLEAIFFAITVVIALIFLFQISPTSIQSGTQSTNELKLLGDDALGTIYFETLHIKQNMGEDYTTNNPSSKLAVCIITNNYTGLTDSLNNIMPDTVLYNIYISNGSKTIFWCSFTGGSDDDDRLTMIDPVALSHHPITIDTEHLINFTYDIYLPVEEPNRSDIWYDFANPALETPYEGATYEVILEMSYIWMS